MLIIAASAALSALGVSSCGTQPFDKEARDRMRAAVESAAKKAGAPGALIHVETPLGTWSFATGEADNVSERVLKADDEVAVGTNAETFVATVVLQLVEEKRLGLNDRLSRYTSLVPGARGMTIRQLLNHTSGLFNYNDDMDFMWKRRVAPAREWKPGELVGIAAGHRPYFAPGKGWHYSDTNYILLGMIVEKVTGNALDNEINDRIAGRLDLKNTYLCATSMVEGPDIERAHGYEDLGDSGILTDATDYNPSCLWAAGAMASYGPDMRTYTRALGTGALLAPDMNKERMTWVTTGAEIGYLPLSYGLGVARIGNFIGHNGGSRGYASAAYFLPSRNAVFFGCLTRYPCERGSADEMVQEVAKVLYPEEFPR